MAKYQVTLQWEQLIDDIDAENEDQAENIALENAMCDEPPSTITVAKNIEKKYRCRTTCEADILASSAEEAQEKMWNMLSPYKVLKNIKTDILGEYF